MWGADLTVEDVVWRVFLELEVPHESHSIRVVRDVRVSIIWYQQQLRVLEKGGKKGWGERREEEDKWGKRRRSKGRGGKGKWRRVRRKDNEENAIIEKQKWVCGTHMTRPVHCRDIPILTPSLIQKCLLLDYLETWKSFPIVHMKWSLSALDHSPDQHTQYTHPLNNKLQHPILGALQACKMQNSP